MLPRNDIENYVNRQQENLFFPPFHHLFISCPLLSFSHQQKLQFLQSDSSNPEAALPERILSPEEMSQHLERLLLEDMASDEQIFDWVEV